MDRRASGLHDSSASKRKIYVVLVGSTTMASFETLLLSLEKFKGILSSDSAKTRFETSLRSIQPSLAAVEAFVEAVYAEKNPNMAVTMTGRTLIIEIALSKEEFLNLVDTDHVQKILASITAVGSMSAKKLSGQNRRDYSIFPIKYLKGKFVKSEMV